MAKKSMIAKAARTPKFKVRAYTRCQVCGRPHSVLRDFGICRICFRDMANKGQSQVLESLLGKPLAYQVETPNN